MRGAWGGATERVNSRYGVGMKEGGRKGGYI